MVFNSLVVVEMATFIERYVRLFFELSSDHPKLQVWGQTPGGPDTGPAAPRIRQHTYQQMVPCIVT